MLEYIQRKLTTGGLLRLGGQEVKEPTLPASVSLLELCSVEHGVPLADVYTSNG